MDSNLPPGETLPQQPQGLKEKVSEGTNEFVKDHYEGVLRRLINIVYALLKFTKNSIVSMINVALGRGE